MVNRRFPRAAFWWLFSLIACLIWLPAKASPGNGAPPSQTLQSAEIPLEPVVPIVSWFSNSQPLSEAWEALRVLADAHTQGLNPSDYEIEILIRGFERSARERLPDQEIDLLDTRLTRALERYLSDLNDGRLSPEVLKHRFQAPPTPRINARAYIAEARLHGRLPEALRAAQPEVPMYEEIRTAMARYRDLTDHPAWTAALPPLPARSLKPGEAWSGVPVLAARLVALGDLHGQSGFGTRYEGELVEAVKRFQTRHGLEADAAIGPATLAQLNVTPAQRVKQMALTMERLRWTPLQYGPRMIVVNVPEFTLRAYELEGSSVKLDLEMRVIVGKALDTETPIFQEDMRFIEFSPYWNVPISIARSETLPRLRRDPGYFSRQGFEFVTRQGSVVTTLTGEGLDAVQRGEWRIRQRPGPQNALGDIKFVFPNDQNIFLHHTSSPGLFSRVRRDFSHGCIRVEHPVQLASFVLKNQPDWTQSRIAAAMGSGKSTTLRLNEPIPVLIAYSTVVVKNQGTVYFYPDIYHQDGRLEQALNAARQSPL